MQIALLAIGVFIFDTATAVDIVAPVLYVNVVLFAMRSGRRSDIAMAGWTSAILTIVSFGLTVRPTETTATAFVNTALSLLAILCVTILGLRGARSQQEILRARARLAFVSRGFYVKTLSSSVVYEVTAPIAEIAANAAAACRSLSRSPPDLEETKAATRCIVQEIERISKVVGRLRSSMASRDVAYAICDVQALVERAFKNLGYELADTGINLTMACESNLTIVADDVLIEQVIGDAISNVMDVLRAVEAGHRRIAVEARALPAEVQISIRANGVGVDRATMEHIFDPFCRESGASVCLAVSKSIIEVHNGTIRAVHSSPDGLLIEIRLPAAEFGRGK